MTLNRALLIKVRYRIAEVGDEHSNMNDWTQGRVKATGDIPCGTSACIAGWTIAMRYGAFDFDDTRIEDAEQTAGDLLGLEPDYDDSEISGDIALFYSTNWPYEYQHILKTQGHAAGMVAVIDALLDGTLDPKTLRPLESVG